MSVPFLNDWNDVLNKETESSYYQCLMAEVDRAYQLNNGHVFPPKEALYAAFNLCSFKELKIVILGQDPYPTKGNAHGLSFSVNDSVGKLPKSLNNIFKELSSDLNQTPPKNGNLECWARQGVLLLNSVLTVEEGRPDSHKNLGWVKFTDAVIKKISDQKRNVVFLLWGAKAQAKKNLIDGSKHLVLESVHPSPLSAYRGFFGCKHFSKTNKYLEKNHISIIKW